MTQALTMEGLLKAVAHPAIEGLQTVILSGNKAYYSPDMAAGEVRVIEIPEFKIDPPPMVIDINYKPRANVCPTFFP